MEEDCEKTKMMEVSVKKLDGAAMVVKTGVVRVPEDVAECLLKQFTEKMAGLHLLADGSDLYEIDVRMAADDARPHFALDWNEDRTDLTVCGEC